MNQNFKTLELAIELHLLLKKIYLPPYQKDQLNRASQSIALNLSEGAARFTVNEKRRFYRMAFGSLRETQLIIKLADIKDIRIVEIADKTGASLYKLLLSLDNRTPKL